MKSQKLRDSAKGQECAFHVVDVCNYNPETTSLCHINVDGGKMGGKSPDISAAFGCSSCHEWLDQNKGSELDRLFYTRRAIIRTQLHWINEGLLVVA
jgi:hypothetical protein